MNFLLGLIASGIAGTLVFIIFSLVRPITERFFSKTWHYYSFFVPLFFLLGGTLFSSAMVSRALYLAEENINVAPVNTADVISQVPSQIPPNQIFNAAELGGYLSQNAISPNPIIPPDVTGQFLRNIGRIAHVIIACWSLGAILFMGLGIIKYLRFRRLALHNAEPYRSIDCQIPIVISTSVHTPMLLGFVKPIIVLPNMSFNDAELDLILTHELAHYKRKDLLIKMAGMIANAVHWFNPAVYALNEQLNIFCELSCDEAVASKMDAGGRRFYGETVLQVLQYSTSQRELVGNLMFATNLCNNKKNIKRRLISMMNGKKMRMPVAALALATALLVAGGGFVVSHLIDSAMPVYAASPSAQYACLTSTPPEIVLPERFQEPQLTVSVLELMVNDVNIAPNVNALPPADVALLGAEYIWDMFGEIIDGKFVALSYSRNPEGALWTGSVSESETAFLDNQTLFFFAFDAITGERTTIIRTREVSDEDAAAAVRAIRQNSPEVRERYGFNEFIQGGPVPALDEHTRIAKELVSPHFAGTEVISVEFLHTSASGFGFDENGELVVTSRNMAFMATDSTGRAAIVKLDEATWELDMVTSIRPDGTTD